MGGYVSILPLFYTQVVPIVLLLICLSIVHNILFLNNVLGEIPIEKLM